MIKQCNRTISRGDIFWLSENISVQLGDSVQNLDRPFIVISNNKNNKYCPTVNIACLSKQVGKANYPMHVLIKGDKYNLEYDSVIYVEQVITINKSELRDKIAHLDDVDIKALDKAIFIQLIDEKGISLV